MKPFDRIKQARSWLSNDVFPLWTERGIHPENGSFIESLNSKGQPTKTSQRSMVQARQIFSYTEAVKMRILTSNEVIPLIQKSTNFLIQKYSLPSGGFIHSINPQGQPEALQTELYNQAFVIFSLARAYEMIPQENIKATAKKLLKYLETERQAPGGGFTEIKNDQICYQSNPHMHLFEAVIEWLKVSSDPEWKQTAQDIFDLCTQKFIDPKVGVVCEFFEAGWTPIKENSRFVFEPGHQYEWAWLMIEFKKALKIDDRHPEANGNLGSIYAKGGDFARAFVLLDVALLVLLTFLGAVAFFLLGLGLCAQPGRHNIAPARISVPMPAIFSVCPKFSLRLSLHSSASVLYRHYARKEYSQYPIAVRAAQYLKHHALTGLQF